MVTLLWFFTPPPCLHNKTCWEGNVSARVLNTTGKRISFHRDEMGMSQEGLTVALREYGIKIERSQLSRIENQQHPPSGQMLSALAHILGVTSDYLLLLSDDPLPPDGSPHAFAEENSEYKVDPMAERLMQYWGHLSMGDQAILLQLAQRLSGDNVFPIGGSSVN